MPDKVALVTGGAVRLGKAISLHLSKAGYQIALHYNSSEDEAFETKREIEQQSMCRTYRTDLSSVEQMKGLFPEVLKDFGRVDLLVNSASMYISSTIAETDIHSYQNVMDVNLRAPFFLTQQYTKHCSSGQIINIIDNKISYNQYVYAAYLLSKKSLAELTKMAALEFAPSFRVNAVSPGVVLPAASRKKDYLAYRVRGIPLSEMGAPVDICSAIEFILSNRFLTGQVITIDGGEGINYTGRNAVEFS